MSAENSYTSIRHLAEELKQAALSLEEGNLTVSDLETMVENSRNLYERLVVLRHFAYQKEVDERVEEPITMEIPFSINTDETVENETLISATPEAPVPVVEESENVLEPTTPTAQTSLIDAIDELSEEDNDEKKEEKSLVDQFADEQAVVSLADKLVKAPIEDLAKAITLNQKFIFISELFGDASQYEQAIEALNHCTDFEGAMEVLQQWTNLDAWKEGDSAKEFHDLLQRRFLDASQS